MLLFWQTRAHIIYIHIYTYIHINMYSSCSGFFRCNLENVHLNLEVYYIYTEVFTWKCCHCKARVFMRVDSRSMCPFELFFCKARASTLDVTIHQHFSFKYSSDDHRN